MTSVRRRSFNAARPPLRTARQLASYFVGQGAGLMNSIRDTRTMVRQFLEDYLAAVP